MQKISLLLIEDAEAAVLTELAPSLAKLDYNEAAYLALGCLGAGMRGTVADGLKAYFHGLWFIENVHLHEVSSVKHLNDAAVFCEDVLRSIGVQPITSKFSALYQRIHAGLAQASMQRREPWLAMWQTSIGRRLAGAQQQLQRLAMAEQSLGQGEIRRAAAEFALAEGEATMSTGLEQARLGRIRCARLLGETDQAHVLAVLAQSELSGWGRGRRASLWYDLLLGAQKSGSASALAVAWQRGHDLHTAEYAAMAVLMTYAVPTPTPQKHIRRASTLKEYFIGDYAKGTRELQLLKMVLALEECQDTRTGLLQRLKNLGQFYAKGRDKWLPEDHLVLAAAVARWLMAHQQRAFAAHILEDSRSLSRRLSQGQQEDVLGLCADLHRSAAQSILVDDDSNDAESMLTPVVKLRAS